MDNPTKSLVVSYDRVKDQHRAEDLGNRFRLLDYDVKVNFCVPSALGQGIRVVATEVYSPISKRDTIMTFDQATNYLRLLESSVKVEIKRLPNLGDIELPSYETAGAAGMDLRAAWDGFGARRLSPGERTLVPCGFSIALPVGYELQVRPRSGLALKHGITVLNSPGTVDSDYRGEVGVILVNLGTEDFVITRGERIAQGVLARVDQARFVEVSNLSATSRGEGGFGSTGRS